MSLRARILAAGLLTMVVGAGYWLVDAWPAWRGDEILLAVSLTPIPGLSNRVGLTFPDEHVAVGTLPPAPDTRVNVTYRSVRPIGSFWVDGDASMARKLRGRTFFLQVEPADPTSAARPSRVRAVSLSDARVDGVVNLRVTAGRVDSAGRFDLFLTTHEYAWRGPIPAGPIQALLRVLPSGRHAVVRLIPELR